MAYLLDANVFIEAKDKYYGFDFCPGFWEWLIQANAAGKVFSIDKVEDEVLAVDDELKAWSQARGRDFFLPTDAKVIGSLPVVSTWASGQGYEQTATSRFFQVADYYLVAHAHAGSHVIVTHEVPSASKKKIKIPDACLGLNIKFTTPFAMLRREHAKLVLGS